MLLGGGSCCESRVVLCIRGYAHEYKGTRFSARPPFAAAAGHVPDCLLRKGGDVPGKEVSGANGWLTSLPFEAGSFALPGVELRSARSGAAPQPAPLKTHGMK
ncbi:hypothetical protein [Paenibacillus polymyxa]|uniref:hypothetical protein n=1 Tax=Paenibacillus polymyxa TaxID=1406 RepID=UPI0001E315D2|nr:hypothetical protein [Paenibacillus polymyxa]